MSKSRPVYSTEHGRLCPDCGQPVAACNCQKLKQRSLPASGAVILQRQVKGRNGKPVTIISGIPLIGAELKALAKQLKNKCGVGGSIEAGNILIQGDKRDQLKAILEPLGYVVKLSGG